MNPIRLRLRGFRTYSELDLDLPAGCVGIVGGNGAGKSSLVTAIELALFGPESRSLAPYVGDTDDLMVELEFAHGSLHYRVRRGYSAKGRGKSTLDLEEATLDETIWAPLTGATAADTQAAIEKLIGLSRETYRASSYLAQGDGGAFSEAQPRDRKRILSDVLGLDIWPQLEALARSDRRAAEQAGDALTARIGLLEEQAADLEERERTVKALALEAFACDEDLADATSTVERLEEQAAEVTRMLTDLSIAASSVELADARAQAQRRVGVEAQAARERADGVRTEIKSLEGLFVEHQDVIATVIRLEQADRDRAEAVRAQRELSSEWGRLSEETRRQEQVSAGLEQKLAALDDDHATCDRCGQTLGTALEVAQASIREELGASEAATADLYRRTGVAFEALNTIAIPAAPTGLAEAKARLDRIADTPTKLAAARAQLTALEETIALDGTDYQAELRGLEEELAEARATLAEIDPVQPGLAADLAASLAAAKTEAARIAAARGTLRDRQAHATAALDQARNAHEQITVHTGERETLQREADLTAQLERAFGRDGVPAHIVETSAIPAIEAEASRILGELGGPVTQVELRTERALKDGGTADALDVICHTEAGERDYATLSGGERERVNLALRMALSALLANRRGSDVRILALDEPAFLDEAGMGALAGVLRDLVQRGTYETAYLVSHVPALRDAFDTSILVTRENGRSAVEIV